MKKKVYIALSDFCHFDNLPRLLLEQSNFSVRINNTGHRLNEEQLITDAHDCVAIIAGLEKYSEYVFSHLPKLQCISRCGVGVDNIDMHIANGIGIKVYISDKYVVTPVVEYVLHAMYSMCRDLNYSIEEMKRGRWSRQAGNDLCNKTVGIIGAGRIGSVLAEVLSRIGVNVLIHDFKKPANSGVYVDLDTILRKSNILTIHISGKDTILDSKAFRIMKKGMYIINTSRGSAIDENALYYAAQDGTVAKAFLDVFCIEPYKGVLSRIGNIVCTPHLASYTEESRSAMELETVENVISHFKNAQKKSI